MQTQSRNSKESWPYGLSQAIFFYHFLQQKGEPKKLPNRMALTYSDLMQFASGFFFQSG